jgi:hypothetical protein
MPPKCLRADLHISNVLAALVRGGFKSWRSDPGGRVLVLDTVRWQLSYAQSETAAPFWRLAASGQELRDLSGKPALVFRG